MGVESVRSGDPAFFISFGHQGAFAVDVVGGAACCALRDSLGNSSPKGVVAVLDGEAICAVLDFAESACCVVAPVSFPACAGFLDEVTQRVVAGAGLFGLALLRGGVFVKRPGGIAAAGWLRCRSTLRPGGRCSGGCLQRRKYLI